MRLALRHRVFNLTPTPPLIITNHCPHAFPRRSHPNPSHSLTAVVGTGAALRLGGLVGSTREAVRVPHRVLVGTPWTRLTLPAHEPVPFSAHCSGNTCITLC